MAESESGLDVMRRRIERAARRPPPPRRPSEGDPVVAPEVGPTPGEVAPPPSEVEVGEATAAGTGARTRRSGGRSRSGGERRITMAPNLPAVNLAIRVRRPLDDRLADLIHTLRQAGVRTSKVEMIELLLWELPERPGDDLRARLAAFRAAAPRGPGSAAEL